MPENSIKSHIKSYHYLSFIVYGTFNLTRIEEKDKKKLINMLNISWYLTKVLQKLMIALNRQMMTL